MTKPQTLKQRLQAPTPAFFKKIRNAGLTLAAVSAAILAGSVASAVSQTTTGGWNKERREKNCIKAQKTKPQKNG